jgi:V/A-type H+/Na+-transporting ATPase subunit C
MLEELFNPAGYLFWIFIIAVIAGAIAILSRPFSTYVKFVYPNAKYEAMGNPHVTEKNLSSLIESKNLIDFKESINSAKDYKITGDTTYDIQKSLDDTFYQTIEMMKKDNSKKMHSFYDTYLEKIDMYLVKKELRNKLKNETVDEKSIENAILPSTKKLLYNIKEANKENLSQLLLDFGFHKDIAKELANEKIDYMEIDNEVDKYIINKFIKVKVPYRCEQGKKNFIRTYLDIYNIKFVLRCKQLGFAKDTCMKYFNGEGREIAKWKYEQLSELEGVAQVISNLEGTSYYEILKNSIEEYNKEKTVQILENRLDSLFLKMLKDISTQNYSTIGPTLRFLVFKEYEIQNLKVIAKGAAEGLSKDFTKKFLVLEDTA